ncbi:hypothetical protein GQX73_g8678 [Xylaria multiplex]|uniref:Uncharacterized protein n=1 Tax=Xylaria multiplex TaxID=323545 RepID=A0A7C8MT18_9PEZI|nr:hypothetical protein GQX73_g8678 [Xylaria multiplex]
MLPKFCASAVMALAIFSASASPLETDLEYAPLAGNSTLEKRAAFQWRFYDNGGCNHNSNPADTWPTNGSPPGQGDPSNCYSAPTGVNWNRVEIDVFFPSGGSQQNSLFYLEKPIRVKSLALTTSQLPGDVRYPYKRIQRAVVYKEVIRPSEMSEEINALLRDEAREASFRKLLVTTDERGAEMVGLQKCHEYGCDAHVHATVPGLVFTSLLSRAGSRPRKLRRIAARYEAAQAANIARDSVLYWKEGGLAVTVPTE